MRFAMTALLTGATVLGAAIPALAHGGQYRGPGAGTPTGPTAPAGTPASTSDWEAWWAANAWRYVNLRERIRERDGGGPNRSGGGLGVSAGPGAENQLPETSTDRRAYFEREVLPVVTTLLADPDAEVRSAATVALGKMGFPRSLMDLRKSLKDEVRDVRDGAVLALGLIQDGLAVEDLQARLLDPKEEDRTRSFAAIGLGFIGGPEAAGVLGTFLDPAADAARVGGIHRTSLTEASAITGLGLSRHAAAAASLRKDYASEKRFPAAVRAFLAIALARLGDRDAIPFLLQGLEHDREPMRQSAAIALGVLGKPEDEAVVKALVAAAQGEKDANARQFSIMALSRIGGDRARETVRRILEKGSPLDRPLAALGAAVPGDREALPLLRRLFREERTPDLKGAFGLALGLLRDEEALPDLRKLAFSKVDRGLRVYCLLAMGLMDDRSSGRQVREVVETENEPSVKMAAATCLGLLQDPATVPVLEKLAAVGDNVFVRSSACRLLGEVGSPLSSRLLARIARDPKDNSVVRMTATAALGNLADRSLIPLLAQVTIDGNYASAVDPLVEIATIM